MGKHLAETERRFAFGENWSRFADDLDEERIAEAERSLIEMLHAAQLGGRSFLDVGCGSGLFSLAAARLGAGTIHSFDYDQESVATAISVRERFYPNKTDWTIGIGDITDETFSRELGTFDIVYAWGVLHHTGAMWRGMENTCALVAPNGSLFLAIYNSQGRRSEYWRRIKWLYNTIPHRLRIPFAVLAMLPMELRSVARATLRGRLRSYGRAWIVPRERGMSRWHDLIDWVGGYPFEVATPEEVFRFCRDRGLALTELKTAGGGLGNNQFVFERHNSSR